jgi:hypothetical protein
MSTTIQQAPGIARTDLQTHDLSIPGRSVIQNRVELGPEAPAARHRLLAALTEFLAPYHAVAMEERTAHV